MNITEEKIIRTCQICKKTYEDTQVFINDFPTFSFAICDDCRETKLDKLFNKSEFQNKNHM